mmetsp:Transcript_16786/g.42694  ORF Transcript_16786/g.42694 Transcript_16786/m.42694 type:complete len:132 (+) Transcript_16786:98-493(+)
MPELTNVSHSERFLGRSFAEVTWHPEAHLRAGGQIYLGRGCCAHEFLPEDGATFVDWAITARYQLFQLGYIRSAETLRFTSGAWSIDIHESGVAPNAHIQKRVLGHSGPPGPSKRRSERVCRDRGQPGYPQ